MMRNTIHCASIVVAMLAGGCAAPFIQTRTLGDGHTLTFRYGRGGPMPGMNDWAEVTGLGPTLTFNDKTHECNFLWVLHLTIKQDIVKVVLEDVTTASTSVIAEDYEPEVLSKRYMLMSKHIPFSPETVPWMFDPQDTWFIFRIDLFNRAGQSTSLYQPCLVSTALKLPVLQAVNQMRQTNR